MALAPSIPSHVLSWESEAEQAAATWLLREVNIRRNGWHITPQIGLASLSHEFERTGARGDFLLTHLVASPILLEIDGLQHRDYVKSDASRDQRLARAGVEVVRIPAAEIMRGTGPRMAQLRAQLQAAEQAPQADGDLVTVVRLCKLAHQIQLVLLGAVRDGWLEFGGDWHIGVDLRGAHYRHPLAEEVAATAVQDFLELTRRLSHIPSVPLPETRFRVTWIDDDVDLMDVDVVIGTPATLRRAGAAAVRSWLTPIFALSDVVLRLDIGAPQTPTKPVVAQTPSREDARWFSTASTARMTSARVSGKPLHVSSRAKTR